MFILLGIVSTIGIIFVLAGFFLYFQDLFKPETIEKSIKIGLLIQVILSPAIDWEYCLGSIVGIGILILSAKVVGRIKEKKQKRVSR